MSRHVLLGAMGVGLLGAMALAASRRSRSPSVQAHVAKFAGGARDMARIRTGEFQICDASREAMERSLQAFYGGSANSSGKSLLAEIRGLREEVRSLRESVREGNDIAERGHLAAISASRFTHPMPFRRAHIIGGGKA